MKTLFLLCSFLLLSGCATYQTNCTSFGGFGIEYKSCQTQEPVKVIGQTAETIQSQ